MRRRQELLLVLSAAPVVLLSSCGEDGDSRAPTATASGTPAASRTLSPDEYNRAEVRGGSLEITRFTGEPAWYSVYSEDWYAATSLGGRKAVIRKPPEWAPQDGGGLVIVLEEFGASIVEGTLSPGELLKIAEGLNR